MIEISYKDDAFETELAENDARHILDEKKNTERNRNRRHRQNAKNRERKLKIDELLIENAMLKEKVQGQPTDNNDITDKKDNQSQPKDRTFKKWKKKNNKKNRKHKAKQNRPPLQEHFPPQFIQPGFFNAHPQPHLYPVPVPIVPVPLPIFSPVTYPFYPPYRF
uniref:Uncharacterized protein n=1 Tax=Clytia hemisphaerica TaxID=252671 RepID=A0A7M5UNW7_9CNID